jgi:nickel transport protein
MVRLLLTFILTLGFISTSLAHRVNVFCWVEGGKIYCTGKFASGTRVKNGQIKILAKKSGQVLAEGRTNDQGERKGNCG